MKRKIIIDTDAGHDDAMAIMLAVKSNKFDVLAITTVCGNSTLKNTTRNAQTILEMIDKPDISVFSGAKKPLKKPLATATVHGKSGLDGVTLSNKATLTNNAVDKIIELVKKHPREISLICIAPLTNIALAIQKDPQTMRQVKEIVIMGGAIDVPGNMTAVAEFNMFVDPDAAKIVLEFPIKKILIPLDACNKVQLTLDDFRRIKNTKLKKIILRMMEPFIRNLAKDLGAKGAIMYDPLPIFHLLSPQTSQTIKYHVAVEEQGKLTRGMTVVDKRKEGRKIQPNTIVVTSISVHDFKKNFTEILSR